MAHAPVPFSASEHGIRVALIFALAAERLSAFYEHDQWLTEAQGATLAAEWLARSKRRIPAHELRQLSALSDTLARQVQGGVAREAGLYITHEMMEALDPNHESETAQALMAECERLLEANPLD